MEFSVSGQNFNCLKPEKSIKLSSREPLLANDETFKPVGMVMVDIMHQKTILLEQLRDALEIEKQEIQGLAKQDISNLKKRLAPRVYGWNAKSIPGLSDFKKNAINNSVDNQEIYECIRGLETQNYALEDESIMNEYFGRVQDLLVYENLKQLPRKYLKNYPWLAKPKLRIGTTTKPKPKSSRPYSAPKVQDPSKKTISQAWVEKELMEKETALRKTLETQFQANSIPASSMVPRYSEIMATQGNRAMEIRNDRILKRKKEQETPVVNIIKNNYRFSSKKERVTRKPFIDENCTFKPAISPHIPDFKKSHRVFEKQLLASKNDRATTIIVPFKMSTAKPRIKKDNVSPSPPPTSRHLQFNPQSPTNPPPVPKDTKAFRLKRSHHESKAAALELIKEIEAEKLKVAKQARQAIAHKIRLRMEWSTPTRSKTLTPQSAKRHQQMDKEYQEKLEEMERRLQSKKTLFETVQIEAKNKKILLQLEKILNTLAA